MVVATWNLENLFRPGADAAPRDEVAYERKIAALADGVRALAPDVLAVQEVGEPEALGDLVEAVGGRWHAELSTFPDDRGIRVGFLARTAFGAVHQIRELADGLDPVQVADDATSSVLGRGALHVTVDGVDLVTCHLKSKLLSFPGGRFAPHDEAERARFGAYALYRRAAEAATLRTYVDDLLGADAAVVVLGDLNDEPQAATTQILLGPPGSEIGTAGFATPDRGDPQRLWNLAPRIPAARRRSRRFRGRDELIDHVLVSHRLVRAVQDVDTRGGPPPSITEQPGARRDAPGSDHLPVVARFDL